MNHVLVRVTIGVIKDHEQKKVRERSIYLFLLPYFSPSLKRSGQKLRPETQMGHRSGHRRAENA